MDLSPSQCTVHVGSTAPWWPAVVIAALALLFTVASFWWLNARQGRLQCFEPHSFAAYIRSDLLLLRLPLALYNTGARPLVVQDLRLRFPDEPGEILGLPWRSTRRSVKPSSADVQDLPAVFSIEGRQAKEFFIEFGGPFPGFEPQPRQHRVCIEARLGHKSGWQSVLEFRLRLGNVLHPESYIAYSNSDDALSPKDKAKAEAALTELIEQLQQHTGDDHSD